MDPDEVFNKLLAHARTVQLSHEKSTLVRAKSDADLAEHARQMADLFIDLDEWLRRGGFLPKPWHEALLGRVLT